MASQQWRLAVVLLLLFFLASSMAVPVTRSLKTEKDQVSSVSQVVTEMKKNEKVSNSMGKNKNVGLADYHDPEPNPSHNPVPPKG